MRWLPLVALVAGCQFGGSTDPEPAAELYEPCDFSAECVSDAELCYRIRVGGPQNVALIGAVCTVECASSDDCPADGICADFNVLDELLTCQLPCEINEDCPEKYDCTMRRSVDRGQVGLCSPTCREPGPPFGC